MRTKLLLVDDEAGIRNLFTNVAERMGYEVTAVETVDQFLASYKTQRPSIVVMDLMMPRKDGVELLKSLADDECDLPIVLISGSDGDLLGSVQRLGLARGLDIRGVLTKPIMLDDLEATLKNVA